MSSLRARVRARRRQREGARVGIRHDFDCYKIYSYLRLFHADMRPI